ncbi:TetR/AcrR family transcriptional regulator [Sphingomicrobium sediminis]|uniref:TetR family transcriptional regulator n=1 Tax=Sphingomicrobium sediminis TaxID=2950949 RepID=A0A9X2J4D3_9SPHN|nr:TetR family transcriptional regulator [Sphingomicrobium sediminis]MCM8558236.1 TetR family transcriptional regulator [Sphingomicrobium sediminis]
MRDGQANLQAAKRSDKRGLILARAVRLFNEQGYFDTRLEDVAAALDTAKTSISYHFQSKEALLAAAYEASCDAADAELELAAQAPDGLARIRSWIRNFAHHAADEARQGRPVAMLRDPAGLGGEGEQALHARLNRQAAMLQRFVDEGIADGSLSPASGDAAVQFILSLHYWLGRWLARVPLDGQDQAIDAFLDLLTHGLATSRDRQFRSPVLRDGIDAESLLFDREARNRMKLDAFVRVGTRHLNRRGYRALSVNDIANDLGVTRGTFYYHFEDKAALLEACVERSLDRVEEAVAMGRAAPDGLAGLFDALSRLFDGHVNDVDPLLRVSLYPALAQRIRPLAHARLRRATAGFGELVAQGMADGSVRPVELEAVETMIFGVLTGATLNWSPDAGLRRPGSSAGGHPHAADYFAPLLFGIGSRS